MKKIIVYFWKINEYLAIFLISFHGIYCQTQEPKLVKYENKQIFRLKFLP